MTDPQNIFSLLFYFHCFVFFCPMLIGNGNAAAADADGCLCLGAYGGERMVEHTSRFDDIKLDTFLRVISFQETEVQIVLGLTRSPFSYHSGLRSHSAFCSALLR